MNYQNSELPKGAEKLGSTPSMNNETVAKGILAKHLAPRGKYGFLVVEEGSCQFVWEDEPDNVIDADKEHPIVIQPERFHHVILNGPVVFRVEFYKAPLKAEDIVVLKGIRPGEEFL